MSVAITIAYIDDKKIFLSDGSQLQFLLPIYPPKSWKLGDKVEVDEMKMKVCRITNITRNKTLAEAFRIKGPDRKDATDIVKSMDGEYPKTHLYMEWDIEKLFSHTQKILLSDNSMWELSSAFTPMRSEDREWSEGQTVEISPLARGSSVRQSSKLQLYAVANKDINLTVTGSFLGFLE